MRVRRAGPPSRLNGSQTPIWKRLDLKISFPRRQQRLVWLIFSAGQRFASRGDPCVCAETRLCEIFFQPFKWLDPRLPFCKAPQSGAARSPPGHTGPFPGRKGRLAGLCRRVCEGAGRSGRRLRRRLIHKSPLTFSASPFMTEL